MKRQYTAIDIANYILWYAQEKTPPIPVTALKLQKLLYYVVTTYLQEKDALLYSEKIEKWRHGPVTPSIYHIFKGRKYGANLSPVGNFINGEIRPFSPDSISEDVAEVIKRVVDEIGGYSPLYLVDKTHEEEAWKKDIDIILGTWDSPTYETEELKEAYSLTELTS